MYLAFLTGLLQAAAPVAEAAAIKAPIVKSPIVEVQTLVPSAQRLLPPPGGAWIGEEAHEFLDGAITLFCGSHGTISGQSAPPDRRGKRGATISQAYDAVFKGELTLRPPIADEPRSFRIEDPIRMSERQTLIAQKNSLTTYATELTAIDFRGDDFPSGVLLRESPARASIGRAELLAGADGTYRIGAAFSVWLEISTDGGRSWHLADNAVSMHLEPEVSTARLSTRPAD